MTSSGTTTGKTRMTRLMCNTGTPPTTSVTTNHPPGGERQFTHESDHAAGAADFVHTDG